MNALFFALALWANLVTSASIPTDWPTSNDIDSIRPIGIPPWAVQDKHATHNPDSFKKVVDPELHSDVIVGNQAGNYENEGNTKAPCSSDDDCLDPAHCYQGVCRAMPLFINIKSGDDANAVEEA